MRNLMLVLLMLGATTVNAECIQFVCEGPAARTDGTALSPSEIGGYTFERGTTPIPSGDTKGPKCGYKYCPPVGQCVQPGETFRASAYDTAGRTSSWMVSRPIPANRKPICTTPPDSKAAPKPPVIVELKAVA